MSSFSFPFILEGDESYPRKCHPTTFGKIVELGLNQGSPKYDIEVVYNAGINILMLLSVLIDVVDRLA